MINFSSIVEIKRLMNKHGIGFRKPLGQNFLVNEEICEKIVAESSVSKDTNVIEIGPGIGTLTRKLAKRAKKVVCIEIDTGLIAVLDETLRGLNNTKVINADVLDVDIQDLIDREFLGERAVVCSNLPYYITSPVIMKLISGSNKRGQAKQVCKNKIDSVVLLLQKEAAARIAAQVGTRDSGAISVAVSYYCEPHLLFKVSRGNFVPTPNVDSQLVKLNLRSSPAVEPKNERLFFRVVKAGFSQRRKTILNSLGSGLGFPKSEMAEMLELAAVSPKLRMENLSMQDIKNIADQIYIRSAER